VDIQSKVAKLLGQMGEASEAGRLKLRNDLFVLLAGGDPQLGKPNYEPLEYLWELELLDRCLDILKLVAIGDKSPWSVLLTKLYLQRDIVEELGKKWIIEKTEGLIDDLIAHPVTDVEKVHQKVMDVYGPFIKAPTDRFLLPGVGELPSQAGSKGSPAALMADSRRSALSISLPKGLPDILAKSEQSYIDRLSEFFKSYFDSLKNQGYSIGRLDSLVRSILSRKRRKFRVSGLFVSSSGDGYVREIEVHRFGDGSGTLEIIPDGVDDELRSSVRSAREAVLKYLDEIGYERPRGSDNHLTIEILEWQPRYAGRSLGLTTALAILCKLTDAPLVDGLAVTGLVRPDGSVEPVGGVRAKALAARKAGIRKLIIPKGNLGDVPEEVREDGLEVVGVESLREAADYGLERPPFLGATQGLPPTSRRPPPVIRSFDSFLRSNTGVASYNRFWTKGKHLYMVVGVATFLIFAILAYRFFSPGPSPELAIALFEDFTGGDPREIPSFIKFQIEKDGYFQRVRILERVTGKEEAIRLGKKLGAKFLLVGDVHFKEKGNATSPQTLKAWVVDLEHVQSPLPVEVKGEDMVENLGSIFYANALLPVVEVVEKRGIERVVDPKFARLIVSLATGDAHLNNKEYDRAVEQFQKGTEIDPSSAVPYFYLGLTYDEMGRYDEAISMYQKALARDPYLMAAHNNLGWIYEKMDLPDAAIDEYKKAIGVFTGLLAGAEPSISSDGLTIMSQESAGRRQKATGSGRGLGVGRSVRANSLTKAVIHYNLGTIYMKEGNYLQAIKDYEEAISLDPSFGEAYNNLGWIYYMVGDYDRAIRMGREAASLSPRSPVYRYNLGLFYLHKGLVGEAMQEYKDALRLDMDRKAADLAARDLREALERKPDLVGTERVMEVLGAKSVEVRSD
jgi:tetratricopeptide (TPR) repeat protein